MLTQLLEKRGDLKLYKKLLLVLGEYCDRVPATGISKVLDELLKAGSTKVLPKDPAAVHILWHCLEQNCSAAAIVQHLMNDRFSDLPLHIRPCYMKDGRKHVAFWERDGKCYDRVMSLINIESTAQGHWTDEAGKSVKLIDLKPEEK
jgi:hypothetical protein